MYLYSVGHFHSEALQRSVFCLGKTSEVVRLRVPETDTWAPIDAVVDCMDVSGVPALDIGRILPLRDHHARVMLLHLPTRSATNFCACVKPTYLWRIGNDLDRIWNCRNGAFGAV